MTGNITKFNKATATLNINGRKAGFRKGIASVNVADELKSRGIFFGPERQSEGM